MITLFNLMHKIFFSNHQFSVYIYFFKLMCFFSFFCIFFVFFFVFAKEINHKNNYSYNVTNGCYINFKNPSNFNIFEFSTAYKISSFYNLFFKIFITLFLSFGLIGSIRFLRIGQTFNLKLVYDTLISFPFLVKISSILILLIYIFIFKILWEYLTFNLFFELKKIHIFFNMNDKWLNIESITHSVYYELFHKPLKIFYTWTFYIHYLYEDKNDATIPKILMPIRFIINHCSQKLATILKYLIKQLDIMFWSIVKILPLLVFFFVIFFEYHFYNGYIKYFYNISFFIFFYKIFLDIIIFSKNCQTHLDQFFCLIYYRLNDLKNHTDYIYRKRLTEFLINYLKPDKEEFSNLYLFTGLNGRETSDLFFKNKPGFCDNDKHNDLFNWFNKLYSSKFFMYFEKIVKIISLLIYPVDKKIHEFSTIRRNA